MHSRWLTAAVTSLALCGCASTGLQSVSIANANSTTEAERALATYNIPRALLTADLIAWSPTQFGIAVRQPVLVPDSRFAFALRVPHSIFSDDAARVSVEPVTRFITGVNVVVDDRTIEIAQQIAGIGGAARAASFNTRFEGIPRIETPPLAAAVDDRCKAFDAPRVLTVVQFDPLNPTDVARAEAALNAAVRNLHSQAQCPTGVDDGVRLAVNEFAARDGPAGESSNDMSQAVERRDLTNDQIGVITSACERGVCMPQVRPFVIAVTAPRGEQQETLVNLPDARHMIVLPVRRGALTRRTTEATFASGLLQHSAVTQESEALAFVSLPLTVVRAFFGTFTEVIQLRVNVGAAERNLASNTASAADAKGGPGAPSGTAITIPPDPRGNGTYAAASGFAPAPTTVFMIAASRDVAFSTVRGVLEPKP